MRDVRGLLRRPFAVAPMAGGPSTPDLVVAAAEAGALGILAGGYKTAAALTDDIADVRARFLRCPESGAHPAYKAALVDPRYTTTTVTRAFSGRPARGLVNGFLRRHGTAPAAYPEVNNATRPLRSAAAARGDADGMSLRAGQGFRGATALPAGEVVELLAPP